MSALVYPSSLRLTPVTGPVKASVMLPGSKSITNRALLLAALADGESRLQAPLHSEDTHYMTQALRELGVAIAQTTDGDFQVRGRGGVLAAPVQDAVHWQFWHDRSLPDCRRLPDAAGNRCRAGRRGADAGAPYP